MTIRTRSCLFAPYYSLLAFDQPWYAEIAIESVYQHEIRLQHFVAHNHYRAIAVLLVIFRAFLIQLERPTAAAVNTIAIGICICIGIAENVDVWTE